MLTKKRLPIDVSRLETLINENYVYIDKTKEIHSLITNGRLYLFTRPRRFGKSLLISTLAELFKGRKELFKELWIGQENRYHWQARPVLQLDFSKFDWSSKGRIDLILKTASIIYIFELKLDQKSEVALQQIKEKRYYEPYLGEGKEIVLIGLAFMFEQKRLEFVVEWLEVPQS